MEIGFRFVGGAFWGIAHQEPLLELLTPTPSILWAASELAVVIRGEAACATTASAPRATRALMLPPLRQSFLACDRCDSLVTHGTSQGRDTSELF